MKKKLMILAVALAVMAGSLVIMPASKAAAYTGYTPFSGSAVFGQIYCTYYGSNVGVAVSNGAYSSVLGGDCVNNGPGGKIVVSMRHAVYITSPVGGPAFTSYPANVTLGGGASTISAATSQGYNGGEIRTLMAICNSSWEINGCSYPYVLG